MAAVNRPTDVKQKEADINQKLQLYGIYSGMSASFSTTVDRCRHGRATLVYHHLQKLF